MNLNEREQIIYVDERLSTKVFYEDILKQISWYVRRTERPELKFDFSKATHIDPAVVPNLLCAGKMIRDVTSKKPKIYIPLDGSGPFISGFLWDTGFYKYASEVFDYSIPATDKTDRLPEYFKAHRFDDAYDINSYTKETVGGNLEKIFYSVGDPRFSDVALVFGKPFRDTFSGKPLTYKDAILEILKQLIYNSIEHGGGHNACFALFSTNNKFKKIVLTVSDCGMGFFTALNEKISSGKLEKDCYNPDEIKKLISLGRNDPEYKELYAIIAAFIYRKPLKPQEPIFGLAHVLDIVRHFGATARIHSESLRLIITDHLNKILGNCDSFEKYIDKIEEIKKQSFHVKTGLRYRGVHIEIEIPYERD